MHYLRLQNGSLSPRMSPYLVAGLLVLFCIGQKPAQAQFTHRGYLGWITDLATQAHTHEAWPVIAINDSLLNDYDETFRVMHETGLNELSLWGMFVSHAWPVNVEQTLDEARERQVLRLLQQAHRRQIRVLAGMGVYSWGFDDIINANPHLSQGNAHAMCLHVAESWTWQKRVIDYAFRLPIDGLSLQSADLGRCQCDHCKPMSDAEYHAAVNQKVVQYVRRTYPGKLIGISGWGMDYSRPEDLPHLVKLTRGVDYFIEVRPGRPPHSPAFRQRMVDAIKPCVIGSTGTPNVEPPQHWARTRWFLPTAKRAAQNLQQLYREGGRACENYMHILTNPGDEATIRLMAAIEQHPRANWQTLYRSILQRQFRPRTARALADVLQLFIKTEDAYFAHVTNNYPTDIIRLEPLSGDHPGPAIYLTEAMTPDCRRQFGVVLQTLLQSAQTLRPAVGDTQRWDRVIAGLTTMLDDAAR